MAPGGRSGVLVAGSRDGRGSGSTSAAVGASGATDGLTALFGGMVGAADVQSVSDKLRPLQGTPLLWLKIFLGGV